ADEGTPAAPKPPSFTLPAEKTADIAAHFRQRREYLRERDERRADDEEQRVRQLKDELAIENLFAVSGALVRESHDALAAGSPSLAISRCKLAVELAPAMEQAHLCLVRAILAENPAALQPALSELSAAVQTGLRDPRLSRALLANVLAVLFLGLLAAAAAFVVMLFARYMKLYAHDVQHLFPEGARRWQTVLLGVLFVLCPLFLLEGPLPLVFTALVAVALYLNFAELFLAVLLLGAVAAAPFAAESIAKVASFSGAGTDVWLIEHGEGSRAQMARLQKRLETGNDFAVDFALAHKAKRDGDLASGERLYQRAIEAGSNSAGLAAAHNNLGNVFLLQGDGARAQAQYQQAIDLREGAAAPHFNLSRALGLNGVEALEKVQAEQARANDLDRSAIHDFVGDGLSANHKSNKFVLDMPLDDELLAPLFLTDERTVGPAGDEVRARLSYGLPQDAAVAVPVFFAVLILVLFSSRKKLKPSGACERCGREVCRRCDPDARPSEHLCAQCVNVFIRRTGVEPQERVRKELAAQRYQRRRQVLARLFNLLSGAGHVLAGHPLRGFIYLSLTSSLVVSVVLWHGLAHGPVAVRSGLSLFRIGLTAAAFLAVYAVCLRDLLRRESAGESA
ncbi:MAG TPA: tetratricopeptide repeat protein, partial [Myxococcales bacterium]